MSYKKLSPPQKWIIKGIPLLFLIGSAMHFVYELSGNNIIVGLLAPVNESLWEHLKMILLPVILWWTIYYIVKGKEYCIDKNKWFISALIALLIPLIATPLLHYFYTNAFGAELVIVDIIILFISFLAGQLLALHYYRHSGGISYIIPISIFIILILIFIIFTLYPPMLPIFKDSLTGRYGMN